MCACMCACMCVSVDKCCLACCSHFDGVRALAFHPVEPVLLTASEDHTLKLWNLQKTVPTKKYVIQALASSHSQSLAGSCTVRSTDVVIHSYTIHLRVVNTQIRYTSRCWTLRYDTPQNIYVIQWYMPWYLYYDSIHILYLCLCIVSICVMIWYVSLYFYCTYCDIIVVILYVVLRTVISVSRHETYSNMSVLYMTWWLCHDHKLSETVFRVTIKK